MDTTVGDQQASGRGHPTSVLASLQIVSRLLSWLTGLFHLTPEEKENAGIYLDHQR